uniref:Amino acid permease/ SLC12A domain-containing protein n=1 Tax=Ascaris lumbricoides TaxID=6252 RepID=A0A9J2P2V1_ASCLU
MAEPKRQRVSVTPRLSVSGVVEPRQVADAARSVATAQNADNRRGSSIAVDGEADLGVMLGVYLPTIQHILGVTMFIRLFWVVGIAGVGQTFVLLFLCCFCMITLQTFLTCISLSAVATNGVVESGGPYFMISRNLGPEFGSALGILFFLANTVAASMYLVGGVEIILVKFHSDALIFMGIFCSANLYMTVAALMGMMSHNLRIYSTVLLLIEFAIVAMGVRFVQLFAPVSLVCVILSILACYAGGIARTLNPDGAQHSKRNNSDNFSGPLSSWLCPNGTCSDIVAATPPRCINGFPGFGSNALIDNLRPFYLNKGEYAPGEQADRSTEIFQDVQTTFFVLLAIYFPAVTGILTGTNMSGDLKNPQSSIPGGTIAAQLTTSFIYFSLALVFGAAIEGPVLRDKYGQSLRGGMIVANLAWPSAWVLLIGSFTSTFGAALQCLCSAPRLLQSIAKDDVIPILRPFAKVTKNNEPFVGLILTTVIAELAILLGAMDQIAAVVDFFFLMCYAFVNLICCLHSLLGAPNWRPRFKYYHWSLSLIGTSLCFFIMFSTHWDYAIVSSALCLIIYKYVEWKGAKKEWGDGMRGLALTTAQYSLMKIDEKDPHPKNFRQQPQLLLLLSMPWSKETVDVRYINLINLASQLKAGRGLCIVVAFIRGNPLSIEDRKKAEQISLIRISRDTRTIPLTILSFFPLLTYLTCLIMVQVKVRMEFDMNQTRLRGFAKTLVYGETQMAGSLSTLIQSVGIGGLRPNTLLLSWPIHHDLSSDAIDSEYHTFTDKLHAGVAMDMCLLVAKGITEFPVCAIRLTGTIDVYWIVQDGGLCILVSYLLKQSKVWRGCKLRVIAIAQEMDNNTKMQADLQRYVYQLRIDAKILVVELADPEISKNAFERTLLMEERTKFLHEIQGSRPRQAVSRPSPLVIAEQREKEKRPLSNDSKSEMSTDGATSENGDNEKHERNGEDDGENVNSINENDRNDAQQRKMNGATKKHDEERNKKLRALDKKKVRKMHTAVRLNELILEHSSESQLILLNLPKPPIGKDGLDDYMHYLEVLTDNLPRVLFVRGTGKEVITTYS